MKLISSDMIGKKVFVYWNLHKDCWSIRDHQTKKVIAHSFILMLKDVKFHVSEKGRQRVIKTGHKNVHAGVIGTLCSDIPNNNVIGSPAYYNPHKQATFTSNGVILDEAPYARFFPDRKVTL